jgi:hypothetical protein
MTTAPEGRGGYRQPNNPAPVSGPGMLSKRTDGGAIDGMTQPQQQYTGLGYGETGETNRMQGMADMAGNPFPTTAMPKITPLGAPTERESEGMTFGIPFGDGPDSLDLPNMQTDIFSVLKEVAQNDRSGDTELIYRMLEDSGY